MNRFDQRKITKNLISLRKAIQNDVSSIADKLHEQKVFSGEVRQEIRNLRSQNPQLQCGVLINYLLRSGKDAYCKFKNILEDMGQFEIVTAMEKCVHKGEFGSHYQYLTLKYLTFTFFVSCDFYMFPRNFDFYFSFIYLFRISRKQT